MSQEWDANQYIDQASFVAEYGLPVLELLNPKHGERILDLGCGDGALTQRIAQSAPTVHGVDASPSMIEIARKRGLSAEVMRGESLTFHEEFDAVFSNAALHWMLNTDAVLGGVFSTLKPGGRFVGEFGAKGNVDSLVAAMDSVFNDHPEYGEFKNPWYFPSVEDYQTKLQNNGFKVHSIERIDRPTPLSSGPKEWLKIFADGITKSLDLAQRERFLSEVEDHVKPSLFKNGQWIADYVRLRFSAQKA